MKSMLYALTLVEAVLGTLEEFPDGIPESAVYLALNSNYELSTKLISVLTKRSVIQVKNRFVTKGVNFDKALNSSRKCIADIKRPRGD